jgi:hypothetical protein
VPSSTAQELYSALLGLAGDSQVEANGGGKPRLNEGIAWRPPSKGFFLDLRLRNPFYADLSIRKPKRLRRW